MATFTEVEGIPATANRTPLTDLLRDQMGFPGLRVSDNDADRKLIAVKRPKSRIAPPNGHIYKINDV